MTKQSAWAAIRQIVADRDGYKCHYCNVPTAATIEHLQARKDFGAHEIVNLVLACPYCNSKRGSMPLEEWRAKRGWVMPLPAGLEEEVEEMIRTRFKAETRGSYIWSGSTNARVKIGERVVLQIRSGKKYPWAEVALGTTSNPRTVAAVYDFLRRHNTKRSALNIN